MSMSLGMISHENRTVACNVSVCGRGYPICRYCICRSFSLGRTMVGNGIMIWRIALAAFLTLCIATLGQQPRAQFNGCSAGFCGGVAGAATFKGAGNIVSNAYAWWSIYSCYTATYVGNVADIYAPTDASHTQVTCSTGGVINETLQPLATTCAVSCNVKTWTDQSGNTNCTAASCDASNTTIATRPTVSLNCISGKPCMVCNGSLSQTLSTIGLNGGGLSQPLTLSAVANRTGATTSFGDILQPLDSNIQAGFANSINTTFIIAGSLVTATAADSTFHAFQYVFNGASSDININGAVNTVNAGTNGLTTQPLSICGSGNFLTANLQELGIWGVAFTPTQSSNMSANQRLRWGF